MSEIELLRHQIDYIHQDIATLVCQRLALTERIWKLKKSQNLNFTDLERENKLIQQFENDETKTLHEKKALHSIFTHLIFITKKYLQETINEK